MIMLLRDIALKIDFKLMMIKTFRRSFDKAIFTIAAYFIAGDN